MECESRPHAQTGADLRSRCPKAALHRHPSPTPCQGQQRVISSLHPPDTGFMRGTPLQWLAGFLMPARVTDS